MKPYADLAEVKKSEGEGKTSYRLLDERHGCTAGCATGISYYRGTEYGKPGVHADQEGFLVISGSGYAKIGEEEFKVHPGVSFIAPAKTAHTIKRDNTCDAVEVFWFHAGI